VAQTLVVVEPQRVPSDYVRSTVTNDLTDRLRTISEQIKSRTRLEKIIDRFDLYPEIRMSGTTTEAVEALRKNIIIDVKRFAQGVGTGAFEIAFTSGDPVKARDVTNSIANLFIEDNLKLRESRAMGTTTFLDRELVRMQQSLREKETALREFKEKYRGLLPGNMDQNYRMMGHLQQELNSVNTTIQQTKDRKVLLETQISGLERMKAQFGDLGLEGGDILAGVDSSSDATDAWVSPGVEQLRNQLGDLQSRYSDKHPDVIRLQAAIAKLENEQAAAPLDGDLEKPSEDSDSSGLPASEDVYLFDGQKESLLAELRMIDLEIVKLQNEKQKIKKEIDEYRRRIESGPQIEQMLVDVSRGYDEASKNYAALLNKRLDAQLSENLERAQQGEQFRILDPAKVPEKPFKPQSRKVLLVAFFLALAAGFGVAYLREYLDTSFSSAKELEGRLQMPVLVSIPLITTDKDRRGILVKKIVSATAMVSMASILLYALYFLWKVDPV
jgi:polysaccharide chain length determinant protein (PEP-CTERM system associated)